MDGRWSLASPSSNGLKTLKPDAQNLMTDALVTIDVHWTDGLQVMDEGLWMMVNLWGHCRCRAGDRKWVVDAG